MNFFDDGSRAGAKGAPARLPIEAQLAEMPYGKAARKMKMPRPGQAAAPEAQPRRVAESRKGHTLTIKRKSTNSSEM